LGDDSRHQGACSAYDTSVSMAARETRPYTHSSSFRIASEDERDDTLFCIASCIACKPNISAARYLDGGQVDERAGDTLGKGKGGRH